LSSRFTAFVITITHATVRRRSRASTPKSPPRTSASQSPTPAPASINSFTPGPSVIQSSRRPQTARTNPPKRITATWPDAPAVTDPTIASPTARASPPRYGVDSRWNFCVDG
jgi:hypothetical protein